ncbi:MAG TPA: trehalase-like domain-containing protein, partial [Planctomycetota bacterium]|nr:trehalase-like domain-containing protein [Planctomycetota bacterium]
VKRSQGKRDHAPGMNLEDLATVGNCQCAALVEKTGAIVWCCLPRFDSQLVFASLLDERDGGSFLIPPLSGAPGSQSYLQNTNVLETRFASQDGEFRILELASVSIDEPVPALCKRFPCEPSTRRLWGNFPQAYSQVGLGAYFGRPSWLRPATRPRCFVARPGRYSPLYRRRACALLRGRSLGLGPTERLPK